MAERFKKADVGSLPKIDTFRKVVESAPVGPNTINPIRFWAVRLHDFFSTENQIAKEFPEEGLDQIYELWHEFGPTERRIERLYKASQLPNVPEMEQNEITEIAEKNKNLIGAFKDNLILFIGQNFNDWSLANRSMTAAIQFEQDSDLPRENQMTAFCEAANEVSAEKKLTPEFVRQRTAQWLIEEMFTEGAQYAALYLNTDYDDPTSVRDDIETEKSEIKAALHKKLWDAKTLERRETEFKRLLAKLYSGFNYSKDDDEIISFKELWAAAKGTKNKLEEVSTFRLMDDQLEIYESLKRNEVFNIELSEEEADLE